MQKQKTYFVLLCAILAGISTSCGTTKSLPLVERCVVGRGGFICHNPNLTVDKQDFVRSRESMMNYVCMPPDDYMALLHAAADDE